MVPPTWSCLVLTHLDPPHTMTTTVPRPHLHPPRHVPPPPPCPPTLQPSTCNDNDTASLCLALTHLITCRCRRPALASTLHTDDEDGASSSPESPKKAQGDQDEPDGETAIPDDPHTYQQGPRSDTNGSGGDTSMSRRGEGPGGQLNLQGAPRVAKVAPDSDKVVDSAELDGIGTRSKDSERVVEMNALCRDTTLGAPGGEQVEPRSAESDWNCEKIVSGGEHHRVRTRSKADEHIIETSTLCRDTGPEGHQVLTLSSLTSSCDDNGTLPLPQPSTCDDNDVASLCLALTHLITPRRRHPALASILHTQRQRRCLVLILVLASRSPTSSRDDDDTLPLPRPHSPRPSTCSDHNSALSRLHPPRHAPPPPPRLRLVPPHATMVAATPSHDTRSWQYIARFTIVTMS
jgi:hypothetical protein